MADEPSSSILDYKCSICLELLVEPVELPCKHELCRPCFRHNVEEGNFACPICRKRIASWARKCNREGTLVNQKKWSHIQKLFPDKCLKRLNGEADESEDECLVPPKRILAQSGELRQEYEKEMDKIMEEREKEKKASEELIKTLLEEEKNMQLQWERQGKDDELLAKRIADEMKNESQSNAEKLPSTSSGVSIGGVSQTDNNKWNTAKKRRKSDGKSPQSHKIDKYFSLKSRVNDCTITTVNIIGNDEINTDNDLQLAKALQKKYDEEAIASGKREEYMLRNMLDGQTTTSAEPCK